MIRSHHPNRPLVHLINWPGLEKIDNSCGTFDRKAVTVADLWTGARGRA
jgi:hypothetical protein